MTTSPWHTVVSRTVRCKIYERASGHFPRPATHTAALHLPPTWIESLNELRLVLKYKYWYFWWKQTIFSKIIYLVVKRRHQVRKLSIFRGLLSCGEVWSWQCEAPLQQSTLLPSGAWRWPPQRPPAAGLVPRPAWWRPSELHPGEQHLLHSQVYPKCSVLKVLFRCFYFDISIT